MIWNGEIPTTQGVLYRAPLPSPGIPGSGSPVEVNFLRVVNESGAARTFTLFLNVNGEAHAITPVATKLTIGAAYDDVPVFQLPPGGVVEGDSDGADVSWTLNAR